MFTQPPEATPYNSPMVTATRKRPGLELPSYDGGGHGGVSGGVGEMGNGFGGHHVHHGLNQGQYHGQELSRTMWDAQLGGAIGAGDYGGGSGMNCSGLGVVEGGSFRRDIGETQLDALRTSVAVQLPHLEDASRGRPNGAASADDPSMEVSGLMGQGAFNTANSDVLAALNSLEVQVPQNGMQHHQQQQQQQQQQHLGGMKYYPMPDGAMDGSGQWGGGGGGGGGGEDWYEDSTPQMVAPVSGHEDEFLEDLHALTRRMEAGSGLKSPILSSSPSAKTPVSPIGPAQFLNSTDYAPPTQAGTDAELSMLMDRMMDQSGIAITNPSTFMPYIS